MPGEPLRKILLVEDDPDIQVVATLALSADGDLSVESCSSAREAIERAPAFRPDLILLDVMMPGSDGFTALESLRAMPETAKTPVVFMTARTQQRDLERYRGSGSLGVISKPFEASALAETVRRLWSGRGG